MFGFLGSMKAKPGRRDEVVAILLSGAGGLRAAGCHLYVVGVSETDDQTIRVSEVWESREHHAASLQLPETRAAIGRAMPMLTGEFESHEVAVVGGLGVPPRAGEGGSGVPPREGEGGLGVPPREGAG